MSFKISFESKGSATFYIIVNDPNFPGKDSDDDDKKRNKGNNSDAKNFILYLIIGVGTVVLLTIVVVVIIFICKNKNKNDQLREEVNSTSFKSDRLKDKNDSLI